MTCAEMRNSLEAYADAELGAAELAEFEKHLRDCPACATDALQAMRAKRMVRAAGMRYAPSAEFQRRMQQQIAPKRWMPWVAIRMPQMVAAGIAVALLLVAATAWVGRVERERTLGEFADLHVAALASANPVDVVSTDRHTVKPWFAGKLPFSFNLPELQNSEFTLIGGRVAYFQHSAGAQLIYGLRKHEMSVFIFREQAGAIPFQVGSLNSTKLGMHLETWSDGGLRYCVIGDTPASDVHGLSELLRRAARS